MSPADDLGVRAVRRHPLVLLGVWTVATLAVDQLVKQMVRVGLEPGISLPVVGQWLRFTHVENPGAAFGLFVNRQDLFVAATLAVVALSVAISARKERARPGRVSALGLASGGALGNLVDRLRHGSVLDFIDLGVWPVFNLADVAIVGGVVWLLWGLLRDGPVERPEVKKRPGPASP